MKDFPNWFNTKQDILNVMADFPEETTQYLIGLLTDRFIWLEEDGVFTLSKDANCRLLQLGFTVEEVEGLVGDVEIIPRRPSNTYKWDETNKEWVPDTALINTTKKEQIKENYQQKFEELKSAYLAKIGLGTADEVAYSTSYKALRTALINELSNVGV